MYVHVLNQLFEQYGFQRRLSQVEDQTSFDTVCSRHVRLPGSPLSPSPLSPSLNFLSFDRLPSPTNSPIYPSSLFLFSFFSSSRRFSRGSLHMDLEFQLCFSSAAPSLLFPPSAPSTTFAVAFIPAPPLSLSIFFFPPAFVSRQRHRSDRQRDERHGEREARVRKLSRIKSSCTTNSSSRPAGQPANQSARGSI